MAWLLQVPIARSNFGTAVWLSLASSVLGAALYIFFLVVIFFVTGEETVSTWGDAIASMVSGMLAGAMFSFLFWPVTLPLGWAAILLLRRASGGLAAAATPTAP